jgi:hypothetical protein
VTEFP